MRLTNKNKRKAKSSVQPPTRETVDPDKNLFDSDDVSLIMLLVIINYLTVYFWQKWVKGDNHINNAIFSFRDWTK